MSVSFLSLRNTIPYTPGVYFFRDARNHILYIGKAANLRARLSSYFLKSAALEAAKRGMLREAEHVTWQTTATEIEALLLETTLIKKHRPRFNVVMRDDKQYLFAGFTKETFPRIIYTHQPIHQAVSKKNIVYAGPFTESGAIKKLLRTLRRSFPYCTCKRAHTAPCQQAELGLCFGFCCKKNYTALPEERAVYQKNVRFLKHVLQGKQKQLLQRLRAEMNSASKRKEFEIASGFRDQTYALERIFAHKAPLKKEYATENQKGLHELRLLLHLPSYPKRIEGYDISNIQGTHAVGSLVVFTDGAVDKNEYRKFRIRTIKGANDTAMLREVLTRRLAHADWPLPDVILIDGGKTHLTAVKRVLGEQNLSLPIVAVAKGPQRNRLDLTFEGPQLLDELNLIRAIRDEAHRFAITFQRSLRVKKVQESALDAIPGIGAFRKNALLKKFGSVARLKKATLEEIMATKGMSSTGAKAVSEYLNQ